VERRDFHAGESTSFAGGRPSVVHRDRGQAALLPDAELEEDDEVDDEDVEPPDESEDDDEVEEDPDDDPEDDESDFAGTELLPDDRLSVR
jgi:hypothetical protein